MSKAIDIHIPRSKVSLGVYDDTSQRLGIKKQEIESMP